MSARYPLGREKSGVAEPGRLTVRDGLFPHENRMDPRLFDSTVRRETVRLAHVVVRKFDDAEVANVILDNAATRANRRPTLTILNGNNDTC
jgi:hypothetical protein